MKLLIVDDERIIRRGLAELPWRSIGIEEVLEADSADQAARLLRQTEISIIVCDIQMPGMDGLSFAELVKRQYPQIAVILLSGHGVFSYAQRAIKCDVFEYLLKPSSPEEIMGSVRRAMGKQQHGPSDTGNILDQLPPFCDSAASGEIIGAVLTYIRQHYMQDVSLGALAASMNYSPQYLSRLIKRETQYNFITLLSMARLAQAAELLAKTGEKVYRICSDVGIPDQRYFSQLFKNTFEETPLQFRKAHLSEPLHRLRIHICSCVQRMVDSQ